MDAQGTPPLRWGEDGLIPVVTIDDTTGSVLMLAFMNEQALATTRATGEVHYWSRSRNSLWRKGATSGHVQKLVSIHVNCDQNSVLLRVNQTGAVCHDGFETCYYRRLETDNRLTATIDRLVDPVLVYGAMAPPTAGVTAADAPRETPASGITVTNEMPRSNLASDASVLDSDTEPTIEAVKISANRGDMSREGARLLVRAYLKLNDPALVPLSGTARLLQGHFGSALPRLADELDELAGVLDGSHVHGSFRDDVLLESSQCLYWSILPLIQAGYAEEDLRFETWLKSPLETSSRPKVAKRLRAFAGAWRSSPPAPNFVLARTSAVYPLLAGACRLANLEPMSLIAHELASLRQKPYLAAVFERQGPPGRPTARVTERRDE